MVPNGKPTTRPEFMESVWSSIFGVSQVSTSLSAFWRGFSPTVWVPNPISIHIIWYFSLVKYPPWYHHFPQWRPSVSIVSIHTSISWLFIRQKKQTISPSSTIWVWVNTYYIIHINTIFSGMKWTSIYQLFLCSPGVQGFDTLPYQSISTHGYLWKSTWPPQWPRLGASRIRGSGLFHDGPSETKLATSRPVMPSVGR